MKKFAKNLFLLIILLSFVSSCGYKKCTDLRRNSIVTVSIEGEIKKCFCKIAFFKTDGTVILYCKDGSKYAAQPYDLIECGHEHEFELE